MQRSLSVAFGAVALVLLIACANVANLLLAKGATRRRELAVRAALGAGRGRLVAQLLTESLVLCLLGGVAGVAVADLLIRVATPLLSESLPFTAAVILDWRVLAFAGAIALAVALLAGTLPAMQTAFGNLAESMNRSARGSSGAHAGVRRAIVIGEVALSLVLVSGALLLLRSLAKLQGLDTGVRIENVITMSVDLPVGAYRTPQQAALFYQAAAERLQAAPGVERVGVATALPLQWIGNGEAMKVPGVEKLVRVRFKRVDPGYFRALGIPVLAGRGITGRDLDGTPRVMVINEALAARLASVAGVKNAVGMTVRVSCPGYVEKALFMPEVADRRRDSQRARDTRPALRTRPSCTCLWPKCPARRSNSSSGRETKLRAVMPAIRQAVHEIDPGLPLGDVATMEQVRGRTLSGASRPAWLIGVFAGHRRVARRNRSLRRDFARGDAKAPGDRHPHGARSTIRQRALSNPAERDGDGSRWGLYSDCSALSVSPGS